MKKFILLILSFHLTMAMVLVEEAPWVIDKKQKINSSSTICKRKKQVRTLSVLFEKTNKTPALREIVETNDESLFVRHVLNNPNLTICDDNNENIVHYLVKYKCRSLLNFVFACKKLESLHINTQNKDLRTPLHLACALEVKDEKDKKLKLDIIRTLIKNGAKHYFDTDNKAPFEYLSISEKDEIEGSSKIQKIKKQRKKKRKATGS